MENKEYLQDLKKLINGEMVAAMQYKAIADSIVGEKSLSYIQTHCDEHYQEELGHYTLLVNALMQREGSSELNLSNIIGEALPETVEMTSNNCMDAAEFFSKSEDAAIKAYLEFHEKVKDVDPDLDDIIIGIISDERDHKLDFDRVLNSDEDLETEEPEEETDESDEDDLEDDESEDTEPEKKDKFNFDFSDDEDEEIEESLMRVKNIRSRVREEKESWYYGIPGIRMIWHGEWSDPEVCYNGKFVNEPSVVDTMWDFYQEECEDEGKPVDEDYFNSHYMKDHADEVKDLILDLPSTREDDLEESRNNRSIKRSRVKESRRQNKRPGKKLREAKIYYDLLDGNFKPWGGAVSTWEEILHYSQLEDLNDLLETLYPDGMTEMELNDFLWYDEDGYLDHLLYGNTDDENEDFEDEVDSEEFEEFVNRKINRVREQSENSSRNFVEKKLHNKEKYSESINKFAKRIR